MSLKKNHFQGLLFQKGIMFFTDHGYFYLFKRKSFSRIIIPARNDIYFFLKRETYIFLLITDVFKRKSFSRIIIPGRNDIYFFLKRETCFY